MISDEDLRVDYYPKSTRSSGGAPNEVQGPAVGDLFSNAMN
jgi:hypothetical protein